MNGWIVTRTAADGSKRYDARWRIAPGKIKGKTFAKRKAADNYLTNMVKRVQDGTYVDVQPTLMGEVFDRWLRALARRQAEGGLPAAEHRQGISCDGRRTSPARLRGLPLRPADARGRRAVARRHRGEDRGRHHGAEVLHEPQKLAPRDR